MCNNVSKISGFEASLIGEQTWPPKMVRIKCDFSGWDLPEENIEIKKQDEHIHTEQKAG